MDDSLLGPPVPPGEMGHEKAGLGLSTEGGITRKLSKPLLDLPSSCTREKPRSQTPSGIRIARRLGEHSAKAPPQTLDFSRPRAGPEDLHPNKLPAGMDAAGPRTTL